jgi:hypothetical protein
MVVLKARCRFEDPFGRPSSVVGGIFNFCASGAKVPRCVRNLKIFAAKLSTNKGYKYLTELLHLMGSARILGIYVNTTGIKK